MQSVAEFDEGEDSVADRINTVAESEVTACLSQPKVDENFLEALFFYHATLSDGCRKSLLHHDSCPDKPLLFATKYMPDWVVDCPGVARRLQADSTIDKNKQWETWARRTEVFGRQNLVFNLGSSCLYDQLADTIFGAVLNHGHKQDIAFLVECEDTRINNLLAAHKNHRCRLALARSKNLSEDMLLALSLDATMTVRKAIASRNGLPDDVVSALSADKSEAVQKQVMQNPHLSRRQLEPLRRAREATLTGNATEDVNTALSLLSDDNLDETVLLSLASHAEPVVRYASGLHRKAGQAVHEQLLKDSESWVRAPVAGKTTNRAVIKDLIETGCDDVWWHLSNNPALDVELAVELLNKTDDDQVRVCIAALHIDKPEVTDLIISTRSDDSWEVTLEKVLDPATESGPLYTAYYDSGQLCIFKAIARHPNVHDALVDVLGAYCKADLMANPQYAMAALEGSPVPAKPYSDMNVIKRLGGGFDPAFLGNMAAASDNQAFYSRAPGCHYAHYALLDRLILKRDATTDRQFSKKPFGRTRFVLEALSFSDSTAVRKALLDDENLPEAVLQRLCADKQSSVRLAAARVAKSRGLTVSEDRDSLDTSGKRRRLNKAARIDQAQNSNDIDLLLTLCEDKLPAVRLEVAARKELPVGALLRLGSVENEDEVRLVALENITEKDLAEDDIQRYQQLLESILQEDGADRRIMWFAIENVVNGEVIDECYLAGKLRGMESRIVNRISNRTVDAVLSEVEKNPKKQGYYWLSSLAQVPGLTHAQAQRVLDSGASYEFLVNLQSSESLFSLAMARGSTEFYSPNGYYREPAAQLSVEQVRSLLALDSRFAPFLKSQITKLSDDEISAVLQQLDNLAIGAMVRETYWPTQISAWFFDWCQQRDEEKDDNSWRELADFFGYHTLADEQVQYCLSAENVRLRVSLASNPAAPESALEELAKDKKMDVLEALLHRTPNDLPESILLMLAQDKRVTINGAAKEILKERNEMSQIDQDRQAL